ncbi:MAG: hypothetical protein PUD39_08445 [Bacteroidales bacterium]|nr:hypothetical protein [Bacteroidales bacterium]
MESILPILGIVFLLAFIANKLNKKEEKPENHHYDDVVADMYKSQDKEEVYQEQNADKPDTLGLMFDILNQLGCQPHSNEDGSLSVQYQGENFHMEFGGMYARVWDPMWAGVKADDPDMPKIRDAVNAANFNFGPTVVMTAPNEEGVIGFHSRRDIMLHPACPDNVPFVKAVLDSFFDAKEQVRNSFQQINAKQMEAQKNRRPVGFKTHSNNDE